MTRRGWKIVIGAHTIALFSVIVGCLFVMRTQGVKADVAQMRDEVGEVLTMMSVGTASEAVARHLPQLIDTTSRWERKFATRREAFRGLDQEINQVQAMHRLGEMAERWRKEMEAVSPMQRNDQWQKSVKKLVDNEQKKWPNRTHEKDAGEWMADFGAEFWYGLKHGALWPTYVYENVCILAKGGRAVDRLEIGDRLRFILFPYSLSMFTLLRLTGIALATSLIGYLMCWLGTKKHCSGLSYVGLVYFLYLLNVAFFIVWLEVTK